MDTNTLEWLTSINSSYNQLSLTWWWFTNCSGYNSDAVFWEIANTLSGDDFILIGWTNIDFTGNTYITWFSQQLYYTNNEWSWYFYDNIGWIGYMSWSSLSIDLSLSTTQSIHTGTLNDTIVYTIDFENSWSSRSINTLITHTLPEEILIQDNQRTIWSTLWSWYSTWASIQWIDYIFDVWSVESWQTWVLIITGTISQEIFTGTSYRERVYTFNGVDDYIQTDYSFSADNFERRARFRANNNGWVQQLFSTQNNSDEWINIFINAFGDLEWRINGNPIWVSDTEVDDNKRYYGVITYDGNDVDTRINGVNEKQKTIGETILTWNTARIGRASASNQYFSGSIGYMEVLIDGETQLLYYAWEWTGNLAIDASGNKNHWIITNTDSNTFHETDTTKPNIDEIIWYTDYDFFNGSWTYLSDPEGNNVLPAVSGNYMELALLWTTFDTDNVNQWLIHEAWTNPSTITLQKNWWLRLQWQNSNITPSQTLDISSARNDWWYNLIRIQYNGTHRDAILNGTTFAYTDITNWLWFRRVMSFSAGNRATRWTVIYFDFNGEVYNKANNYWSGKLELNGTENLIQLPQHLTNNCYDIFNNRLSSTIWYKSCSYSAITDTYTENDTTNNETWNLLQYIPDIDLSLSITSLQSSVIVWDAISYSIEFENEWTENAYDVTIQTEYTTWINYLTSSNLSIPIINWWETWLIIRTGTVAATHIHYQSWSSYLIPFTWQISTDIDNNTWNNTETVHTTYEPTADISITKTTNKTGVYLWETITYTINYANSGPDSTDLILNDLVPLWLEFISSTPAPTTTGANWSWFDFYEREITDLSVNGTWQINLIATVASGSSGTIYTNKVTLNSSWATINTTESNSVANNYIDASDLSLTIAAQQSVTTPWQYVNYTINYTNSWSTTATNVFIEQQLDNRIDFISANPNRTELANGQSWWNIGTLIPWATWAITLTWFIPQDFIWLFIENDVTISGSTTERNISDNSWSVSIIVDSTPPSAQLTFSVASGQRTSWSVIATITWDNETITITNNNGSGKYLFTWNWSFVFEYEDHVWLTWSTTATVYRIDTTPPDIDEWISLDNPEFGSALVRLTSNNTGNLSYTGDDQFIIAETSGAVNIPTTYNIESDLYNTGKFLIFTGNRTGEIITEDRAGNRTIIPINITSLQEPISYQVKVQPQYRWSSPSWLTTKWRFAVFSGEDKLFRSIIDTDILWSWFFLNNIQGNNTAVFEASDSLIDGISNIILTLTWHTFDFTNTNSDFLVVGDVVKWDNANEGRNIINAIDFAQMLILERDDARLTLFEWDTILSDTIWDLNNDWYVNATDVSVVILNIGKKWFWRPDQYIP